MGKTKLLIKINKDYKLKFNKMKLINNYFYYR